MTQYTVTAYSEGSHWQLRALGIRGSRTRVPFLKDAEDTMRPLLARLTGDDVDTIDIELLALPGPGGFD